MEYAPGGIALPTSYGGEFLEDTKRHKRQYIHNNSDEGEYQGMAQTVEGGSRVPKEVQGKGAKTHKDI